MKLGNIGNASNVLGNTFNVIMSNATIKDLEGFHGNINLPGNAFIIVNPIGSDGSDLGWHDILVTDNNSQDMGVVSILPFTSVDKNSGLIVEEVKDENGNYTGERILKLNYDEDVFEVIDGKLTVKRRPV